MRVALLVIDMQKGFVKDRTGKIPEKIRKHIKRSHYDAVVFTKFANHPSSNFVKRLGWHKLKTKGPQEIVEELAEFSTPKNTFVKSSYSAFKSKKLLSYLHRRRIKEVVVCGLELDGCVLASAFEAFDLGFAVRIIPGLTASSTSLNKASLNIVKRNIDRLVHARRN
jgi:nicotinamidase-related amidase